jgi:glycosyltransferase involved in cell wall biosynthesis
VKVLLASKFFYMRGGAERWLLDTDRLLRERGHQTMHFATADRRNDSSPWRQYFVAPVSFERSPLWPGSWLAACRMFASQEVRSAVRRLVSDTRPDVAVLSNTYHHLGPSLVQELSHLRVPMLMLLHDYKPVCPSYLAMCHERPCERCANGRFYQAALHGCGGSPGRGLLLALENYWQWRVVRTYDKVHLFAAPGRSAIDTLRRMGFARPVHFLRNSVPPAAHTNRPGSGSAVGFAGRLSWEKGLKVLMRAAMLLPHLAFRIAGEGPMLSTLRATAPANVTFLGFLSQEQLAREMPQWRIAVVPSTWYENCPYAVLEAQAAGIPVVGSDLGGTRELLDGRGVVVAPGDAPALAKALADLWSDPERCRELATAGREFVASECSPQKFAGDLELLLQQTVELAAKSVHG